MRIRYFVMGLVCGMILMGVAMGESTTVYIGQMSGYPKGWYELFTDEDRGYVERKLVKYMEAGGRRGVVHRLIERTCTDTTLRTWDRQP